MKCLLLPLLFILSPSVHARVVYITNFGRIHIEERCQDGKPDGRFEGRTQKMTDILIAAEGFWIPSKECEKYAYHRFRF